MNERGILASYLLSRLSRLTNPEITSQFKQLKGPDSKRVIDVLKNKTKPVTPYNILLTFRDTDKEIKLQGGLLKMIINENFIVDLAKLSNENLTYDYAKEMFFDREAVGNKSTREKSLERILISAGIMVSASGGSSSHKKKDFSQKQDLYHLILMSFAID